MRLIYAWCSCGLIVALMLFVASFDPIEPIPEIGIKPDRIAGATGIYLKSANVCALAIDGKDWIEGSFSNGQCAFDVSPRGLRMLKINKTKK